MFSALLSKTPSLTTIDKESTGHKRRIAAGTGGPSPNTSVTPKRGLEGGPGGNYSNLSEPLDSETRNDLQSIIDAT